MAIQKEIEKVTEVAEALQQLEKTVCRLKELQVVRSRKWIPDFVEWVVLVIYGGSPAKSRNQKGWDIEAAGHEKIQVKFAFDPPDRANRMTGIGRREGFDSLVLVVLSDRFKIREFYKIDSNKLNSLLKLDKQWGSRINWKDIKAYQIPKHEIPNYNVLSVLFE